MSELLNFTGGLVTDVSVFLQKDESLSASLNVHGDVIGDLTLRPGYSRFGTTVASNKALTGLKSYCDITGGTTRLFATATDGNLRYQNGATWPIVAALSAINAQISMTVFLDQLFVVGADTSNNFITPYNIDGLTASTSTNLASAPQAKFCEEFQDQLYFANCQIGSTRYPSRFYRSSLPDANGTTITWPSTNYESISTNNGEEITAIQKNRALNQLLVFKDTSFHVWDGFRIRDIGNVGTSNFRSVVTINFTTYFFAQGKGVYGYSGVDPKLLSRGINKWVKGIQDPTKIHGGKEDERILKMYVGDCIVDGRTYTNCEFRYAVLDNVWTIYQYYNDFKVYAEHKVANIIRVYAGALDGDVHQMALEADAVYTDDGTPINWEFMSKPLDLNQPSNKKSVDRAVIYSPTPQTMQGRMRAKDGDWSTWFSVDKTEQEVNLNPANARFLQFHFSGVSSTSPMKFNGLSFSGAVTSQYA